MAVLFVKWTHFICLNWSRKYCKDCLICKDGPCQQISVYSRALNVDTTCEECRRRVDFEELTLNDVRAMATPQRSLGLKFHDNMETRSVKENATVRTTEVRGIREEEDLNELWLEINEEEEATAVPVPRSQKDYSYIDEWIRSFQDWGCFYHSPKDMAEVGFFSTGKRDIVKCFECQLEFGNWKNRMN